MVAGTGRSNFRDELVAAGILVPTGSDGIYGRSSVYEDIVAGIESLVVAAAASEGTTSYRFPPVMPRRVLEQTGYLSSFPDMIGSVSTFSGDNADHKRLMEVARAGGDWAALLEPADVSLCPAVCHPLYPTLTGTLPDGGRRFDVSGWCFRHEPSLDPARMQSFRQHDLVYVGDAKGASEHRDRWLQQGSDLLASLGLPVETVVANDPFFGRVGRILAENQRSETLEIRGRDPDQLRRAPDGDRLGELPSRPLRRAIRDRHRWRGGGPFLLFRIRARPHHPGPAPRPWARSRGVADGCA